MHDCPNCGEPCFCDCDDTYLTEEMMAQLNRTCCHECEEFEDEEDETYGLDD